MLRYPRHGFAKPMEDTVTRAMLILQNREDYTAKRPLPELAPKPRPHPIAAEQQ